MSVVKLVVTEVGGGRYVAKVGKDEVCRSRTPFFTSARRLLDLGFDADDTLEMSRDGGRADMSAPLGVAAGLTVSEPERGVVRIVRFTPRDLGGLEPIGGSGID